jgi:hypothetical protein
VSDIVLPIAIHRWFEDGESWAYHPSLNADLMDAIRYVAVDLEERDEASFIRDWRDKRLIVLRTKDLVCPNENAIARSPTVFRMAIAIDQLAVNGREEEVVKAMALILPIKAGADSALAVRIAARRVTFRREPRGGFWRSVREVVFGTEGLPSERDRQEDGAEHLELGRSLEREWSSAVRMQLPGPVKELTAAQWCGVTASGSMVTRTELFALCAAGLGDSIWPAISFGRPWHVETSGKHMTVLGSAEGRDGRFVTLHVYLREEDGKWRMVAASNTRADGILGASCELAPHKSSQAGFLHTSAGLDEGPT